MKILTGIGIGVLASMLLGVCVAAQTGMAGSSSEGKVLAPGAFIESCIEAEPSQQMAYSFSADEAVMYNVHYHDATSQQVVYLVPEASGASGNGILKAPQANTYCLMLTNRNQEQVQVSADIKSTAHAGHVMSEAAPEHMHMHAASHEATTEKPAVDSMSMADMDKKSPVDYIRVKTPAGFDAVIGRKNPLPELAYKTVIENGQEIKVFRLSVDDVSFEVFPGKIVHGWGFNGQVPGPTIRVTEGDRIRIFFTNNTDNEHTIHIHGEPKPLEMDGIPYVSQKPVAKGETFTYEFTVRKSGSQWYHCHVDSPHHVDMGMYGAFIVEPKHEDVPFNREYVMILDEWPTAHIHMHENGAMNMDMNMSDHGKHGVVTEHSGSPVAEPPVAKQPDRDWYPETYNAYTPVYDGFTINGRSFPYTEPLEVKEGELVKIRFINAGYQPHFMHVHSHKFTVIARDGSPVDEPQLLDTVEIGPGQRVDILMRADNPGVWPFHCHRLDHIVNENIYPGGMLTFLRYVE